jgi:hypothetical protein
VEPGAGPPPAGGPGWYRARFGRDALPHVRALRLEPGSLEKGQIWLNGRNIGRFWQIGPQDAYKLPVSWLDERNELLIFAEAGHTDSVTLVADESVP